MSTKNIFVKVSGDLFHKENFQEWIKQLSQQSQVVICVGADTQICESSKAVGLEDKKHRTEILDVAGLQLALDELERNQIDLQSALSERGVVAEVIIPVLNIGDVLCQVNGDTMVTTAYLGFDELWVVTTVDSKAQKRQQFSSLPKVQVNTF